MITFIIVLSPLHSVKLENLILFIGFSDNKVLRRLVVQKCN